MEKGIEKDEYYLFQFQFSKTTYMKVIKYYLRIHILLFDLIC